MVNKSVMVETQRDGKQIQIYFWKLGGTSKGLAQDKGIDNQLVCTALVSSISSTESKFKLLKFEFNPLMSASGAATVDIKLMASELSLDQFKSDPLNIEIDMLSEFICGQ